MFDPAALYVYVCVCVCVCECVCVCVCYMYTYSMEKNTQISVKFPTKRNNPVCSFL